MRPDHCPLGDVPCQSMCETPCKSRKPLTRSQINKASGDAQIAFCLDKQPTYEVALAREVERLHGIGIKEHSNAS